MKLLQLRRLIFALGIDCCNTIKIDKIAVLPDPISLTAVGGTTDF
jgi:hypothetical protein